MRHVANTRQNRKETIRLKMSMLSNAKNMWTSKQALMTFCSYTQDHLFYEIAWQLTCTCLTHLSVFRSIVMNLGPKEQVSECKLKFYVQWLKRICAYVAHTRYHNTQFLVKTLSKILGLPWTISHKFVCNPVSHSHVIKLIWLESILFQMCSNNSFIVPFHS